LLAAALVALGLGAMFLLEHISQEHTVDLGDVGVTPGTNPALSPEQEKAAFRVLNQVASIRFPSHLKPKREAITDRSEVLKIASMLDFEPVGEKLGEGDALCLTFRLPNGRDVLVHVSPDRWCFTGGGPYRRCNGDLWGHLGLAGSE